MEKILISAAVVIALIVGGFFFLNNYIYTEKQATSTPTETETELSQEEKETRVTDYIRENISTLSPESEVLGGTFYVTDITFSGEQSGAVEYEDGHIALVADFTYTVTEDESVDVQLTNAREPQL